MYVGPNLVRNMRSIPGSVKMKLQTNHPAEIIPVFQAEKEKKFAYFHWQMTFSSLRD